MRDFTAKNHTAITGKFASTEQRVEAWDRVNPNTGELEQAKLDVATWDAVSGRQIYVDVSVTCPHSSYGPRQRARSNKDGLAACNRVQEKRDRYPPHGGELVPLVFETGGRPADETVAFIQAYGQNLEKKERSEIIAQTWQQYSTLLAIGNAEMILCAIS